jgi:hypothetical protein
VSGDTVRASPVWLFECEYRHRTGDSVSDVFAYLRDLGYEGQFFAPRDQQPIDRLGPAVTQSDREFHFCNNFVLTHSDRIGESSSSTVEG